MLISSTNLLKQEVFLLNKNMQEKQKIVMQTHWVDDGKGGVKAVEISYVEKDKGDCIILTPLKKVEPPIEIDKKEGGEG